MGGKSEMVKLGAFDDVDMAMLTHANSRTADSGDVVKGVPPGSYRDVSVPLGGPVCGPGDGALPEGATGVTSRRIAYATGGIFIALAFMPKLSGILAIMPRPVMGAALMFVAA